MEYDNPFSETITLWWQRVLHTLRGIGARFAVHFLSIVALQVVLADPPGVPGAVALTFGNLFFASYVGLVCLVPRGMSLTGQWLLPTGVGVLTGVALVVCGLPWELAIFWMGAQTWLLRLARSRGEMGWEWSALPWLAIGAGAFFSSVGSSLSLMLPLVVVPVMTAVGLGVNALYNRLYLRPGHKNRLEAAAANVRRLLGQNVLPTLLEAPCRQFVQQCDLLARHGSFSDPEVVALVQEAEKNAAELRGIKIVGQGASPYRQAQALQRRVEALSQAMERYVRASDALERDDEQKAQGQYGDFGEQCAGFHASAVDLLNKQFLLPPRMHGHILQIAHSTEDILECMRSDAADRPGGVKFLARYLLATHNIVDQYLRLSHEGKDVTEVGPVLAKSENLLARLESAFKDEHKQLLQNDTVNLTAELNVLDTLLKMEGR